MATDHRQTEPHSAESNTEQQRVDRVIRLNEEGNRLYSSRQFRKALERFLQAHAIDEDPNLLFNIGNCYEKMGHADAAIEKYREFLAAEGIYPEGRARAEQSLQTLLSDSGRASSDRIRPDTNEPLVVSRARDVPHLRDDLRRDEAWLKRQLPWATLSLGTALSAAGATMLAIGFLNHNEVNAARSTELLSGGEAVEVSSLTRDRAMRLIGAGNRNKLLGGAGLAAGFALLATYAGVDWADGEEALAVSVGDTGSSLMVRGSF